MRWFKAIILGISLSVVVLGRPLYVSALGESEEYTNKLSQIQSCIEIKPTKSGIGVRNQSTEDIIITEKDAGMLREGIIRLELESEPYIEFNGNPKVEVQAGDIEVKDLGWSESGIYEIEVTKTSTKASIIKISDFNFRVDRTTPNKGFSISISGDALVPEDTGEKFVWSEFIICSNEDMVVCSFPKADSIMTTAFTVGNMSYIKNNVAYKMDVAPYVYNGRIMVPIRYAIAAVGISDNKITFQNGDIVISGQQVIRLKPESTVAKLGGEEIEMTTSPIIKEGRLFVPISEIAKLLNVEATWNNNLKVVTFFK